MLEQTATLLGEAAPACAYLEAYRALRTNLLAIQEKEPLRSVLVASSRVADGKTTVAVNLATTLAAAGKRVALVDADLRRPRIHSWLSLPDGPGIVGVIRGEAELDEALMDTELPNLRVLPVGTAWENAPELLGSEKMVEILDTLTAAGGMVLLDSPAATAVVDATVLSRIVDGVLFVVRAGSRSSGLEERAIKGFTDAGGRILGIVLNQVLPRDSVVYRQYYTYGYRS